MIIKNARIFTFDDNNNAFENGYIKVKDGIIAEIGDMNSVNVLEDNEIIDAQGKIVMPGLICTHSHIYSAFARGMDLKGGSTSNFVEVLENLWWRLDKKITHDDLYYSGLVTVTECIKNGVTCLFDHHAGPFSVDGSLDVLEKAYKELGMRGTLCYETSDRDGDEIAVKGIKENARFIAKNKNDKDDMVKGLFGLHASFTLSDKTMEMASVEGNSLGAGYHVHVGEGQPDTDYILVKYGMGVVERFDKFNMINDKSIFAHCIHIREEEKELLKRCNVVHNAESNMNNAVGYCDALDLLNKGVLVGLGSDGFSANPFRAMDTCYVLHKHQKHDPRVMTPNDVIQLAIKNNSKITSKYFNNEVGTLKTGSKADMIMLDYNSPTPVSKDNICGHIIFGMNSNLVTDSIINGKVVMKNRELVNADEKEIFAKSREFATKLWERF